jgi:thioesterase-3
MMETILTIIVRSTEIDVNGHVNNAKYLEYLEWAREEWYEQAGLTYETFGAMGVQTVTVNININYKKECRHGDNLRITCAPQQAGRSSFVLKQEIYNQRDEICADAMVTSVTMDSQIRKSREMPEELRRLFV